MASISLCFGNIMSSCFTRWWKSSVRSSRTKPWRSFTTWTLQRTRPANHVPAHGERASHGRKLVKNITTTNPQVVCLCLSIQPINLPFLFATRFDIVVVCMMRSCLAGKLAGSNELDHYRGPEAAPSERATQGQGRQQWLSVGLGVFHSFRA